jgi:hypothetical protein
VTTGLKQVKNNGIQITNKKPTVKRKEKRRKGKCEGGAGYLMANNIE